MNTNSFENSNVFEAVNEIGYSPKSIVSRIIHKSDTGNITLFAFDENQELSEHTAPFDAMVQILDGQAEIIIDGKKNLLNAGQFIIMPANVPHALNAPAKFKMMLIMIKG
jgi:quercetin dioxygenase-like cupin family protein